MEPNKEISAGHVARLKIKAGVDKACDAVRPTLGPIGMTAVIEYPGLDPIECDDGVTILKNIKLKDRYEQIGVQKIRKGAIRTSLEGGDGTATTTVLTQALVNEAFKEIANDSSKIREVRERLTIGLQSTLEQLTKLKREVSEDDIERIANISSLDPEVARLISEIIKEVGVNGVVTVEKGSKLGYDKEVVKGARFGSGMIAPYFINDFEKEQCVLENPWIALIDRKVSANEQILSLMKSVEESKNKNILIIADDIDSMALATLVKNNSTVATIGTDGQPKQGTFNIVCVKNPYNASRAKDFLFDMAVLTGGTMMSESSGLKMSDVTVALCGKADKVIVTKEHTTIIGGKFVEASDSDMVTPLEARITAIKQQIEETTSDYSKEMLEERLASLTGGIGIIRVGAYTDTDFNAKKYKFENAINATQAALQEGILPGGGMALLIASASVNDSIFKEALVTPFRQMAKNAGIHPDVAWEKLVAYPTSSGYDFKNKKIVDMFEAGIIDPFKVTRLALESAVAITSSLISIETAIVLEEEEIKK